MNNTMKIRTKLRFKEAFRYNLHIAFTNIINYIFLILGIIGLAMFVNNMMTMDASMDVRFSKSFVFLIPPFLFITNVPLRIWKESVKLLNNPILKDEVIYIFSKEDITFQTSQGEANTKWEDYVKIIETKHDFRLFMDRVQAQIIPKYSLNNQEIEQLRDIIKETANPQIIKLK